MYKKIKIKLVLLCIISFTCTGIAQNDVAPLKEYLGITYKALKKKYKKTKIKLQKADDFYFDRLNQLKYYFDKNSKKVYAIVSKDAGYEYDYAKEIPYYVHNKIYLLSSNVVVVDNPESWVMMIDDTTRIYKTIHGYILVDINLAPQDFRFHASKVDSNEKLRENRTKFGDFKDFKYPKFIKPINSKTISRCITQNCDKEGENVTLVYIDVDKDTQGDFKGIFVDGAAHGKGVIKWTSKNNFSFIIGATFNKGNMHGDFEMEVYGKDEILKWSYKGKIANGVITKLSFKNYEFRVYGTWKQLDDTTVLINYDHKSHSYPGQFEIWGVNKTFEDGLNGTFLYDGTGYLFPFSLHSLPVYNVMHQFSTDYYLKTNTKSRVKGDDYAAFEWNYFWQDGTKSPASSLDLPFYSHNQK